MVSFKEGLSFYTSSSEDPLWKERALRLTCLVHRGAHSLYSFNCFISALSDLIPDWVKVTD